MSTSPELVWAIVRNNSSFLRKGRYPNVEFTAEPGNLTKRNCFTHSGLANTKTVDLSADDAPGSLTLTTKAKDFDAVARKPAKMYRQSKLTKSKRAAAKTLAHVTAGSYYRPDLKKAALARLSLLAEYQKRKAAGVVKTAKPKRSLK